jgi:hypothetical protein
MFRRKIKTIAPGQRAQLSSIRDRWGAMAMSTDSIDHDQAMAAIVAAYKHLGRPQPKVVVVDSPQGFLAALLSQLIQQISPSILATLEHDLVQPSIEVSSSDVLQRVVSSLSKALKQQLQHQFGLPLRQELEQKIIAALAEQLEKQYESQLKSQFVAALTNRNLLQLVNQQESLMGSQLLVELLTCLEDQFDHPQAQRFVLKLKTHIVDQEFSSSVVRRFGNHLGRILFYSNYLASQTLANQASQLDFCISILKLAHHQVRWALLQDLVRHCGWIFPWENYCFVCDRPIKLKCDGQFLLHAEGETALLFGDGYSFYFHHGVTLPREYGQLHPQNWKSQWILKEQNAELRRVLIEQISYDRMCQELAATQVDSWQEYTLLRMEQVIDEIDQQPISLLKMTCPSTGHIHALRVPPEFESAREAIRWINWGVDPEAFALQS